MTLLRSERYLFYALLLFWFVGVLMLIIQHPYNCKFFSLPPAGSGKTTPDNPHDSPEADWWFNLTHVMTLTTYGIISCLLQVALYSLWYAQMANHQYLSERMEREEERGRAMRAYGWRRCLRSVFRDSDEELADVEGGLPSDAKRFECVCGCCWCFSTACTVWLGNIGILLLLVYFLLIGYGTVESTWRFNQNPECRNALPTAVYLYAVNCSLVLLYLVLLLMRALCSARSVVQNVVKLGQELHNRVQTRKGRRTKHKNGRGNGGPPSSNPAYAQVGVEAELGLELSEDEVEIGEDDGSELELDASHPERERQPRGGSVPQGDGRQTQSRDSETEESEDPFAAEEAHATQEQPQRQLPQQSQHRQAERPRGAAAHLQQPKPHRAQNAKELLYHGKNGNRNASIRSPPSASAGSSGASPNVAAGDIDADTREQLEMLETRAEDDGDEALQEAGEHQFDALDLEADEADPWPPRQPQQAPQRQHQ